MQLRNIRERFPSWQAILKKVQSDKKKALLLLGCVAALLLILVSEWMTNRASPGETSATEPDYETRLESRLEEMIQSMEGAGRAEVMVTLRTGSGTVYARNDKMDSETRSDGERTQSEQEYVLVGAGSGETGLCLRTESPQVLGVAVVCEGGDNPLVCKAVTETVTAALGISASHISVTKMRKD